MKKKRNLIGLLLVLILFYSCNTEKEFIDENHYQSNIISVKSVDFEALIKESRFKNLLNKVTHFSELNKTSFEEQNGFTISDGFVKIIETDSVKSYTMHIVRDSLKDISSFENLIIQENKISNSEKAAIYKYTPSLITASADNSFVFNGTIQKIELSSNSGTIEVNALGQNDYCFTDVLMCNQSWSGGLGSGHVAGPNCNNINFLYVIRIKILCPDNTGLVSNSGGSSSGSSFGSGDGSGGSNNNGNVSQTPINNENEIITTPILIGNNNNPFQKTPCQKVKDVTNNTDGLKQVINNFKTPQTLNLNFEKGFNFVENPQNQTQLVQNDGNANSTSITVVVTEDGAITGLVHSHFDKPDMSPTFTFEDLMTFNSIYQWRKYNEKSLDNLTIMVVSRAGVFAMQIEDEAMFATNGHNLWTDQNSQLRDEFYKSILEKENLTDEDVIIEVTKGLAKYGIGLYQANSDLSNWNKITVDENNNKVTTPCN